MRRSLAKQRSLQTAVRAFTLIEVLVYLGVLAVLLGIGYSALYHCMDGYIAFRRSVDDIGSVLNTGERWRADVRAVHRPIRLETKPEEQILYLPGVRGEITYRFTTNAVSRRVGNGSWSQLLGNVKASAVKSDQRQNVTAWCWELELQPRSKISRTCALFTFIAVPNGNSSK
jgi:prepilin-type N-terminal cleavage/methylation domain-containing protein